MGHGVHRVPGGAALAERGATIGRQIAEPILLHEPKTSRKAADLRVGELLEQVGLPARRARDYPHQLSGGQRQRVMIALALACRPRLVIADEPTTALDVMVQAQVLQLLSGLVKDLGLALVLISHDLSVLGTTCDRVAVAYAGKVVEEGPASVVFDDSRHPYSGALAGAFLGSAILASATRLAGLAGDPPHPGICLRDVRSIRGARRRSTAARRPTSSWSRWRRRASRPPAFSRGVLHEAHRPHAASRSGSRRRGPSTGSIWRSVPARSSRWSESPGAASRRWPEPCSGWYAPSQGAVECADRRPRLPAAEGVPAARPARSPGPERVAEPRHTVYEAVAEGSGSTRCPATSGNCVAAALSKAGLRPPERFFLRYPHELSGGQLQRVVIAGALVLEPDVLVADEPVSSLDASVRGEILALLLRLRTELGLSLLVVTHDLGLAWNIADRVAVMYLGRIVETGDTAEVLDGAAASVHESASVGGPGDRPAGADRPEGEAPDPSRIPAGCRFRPRCPAYAAGLPAELAGRCEKETLPVLPADRGHHAACVLP